MTTGQLFVFFKVTSSMRFLMFQPSSVPRFDTKTKFVCWDCVMIILIIFITVLFFFVDSCLSNFSCILGILGMTILTCLWVWMIKDLICCMVQHQHNFLKGAAGAQSCWENLRYKTIILNDIAQKIRQKYHFFFFKSTIIFWPCILVVINLTYIIFNLQLVWSLMLTY